MLDGAWICGVTSSRNDESEINRLDPTRPLSSMNRIHLDMSDTLDQTDPAGAMLSVFPRRVIRTESRLSAWGVATLGLLRKPATSGSVSVMPNGLKMRCLRKSSQVIAEARSITMPATPYITF